MGLEVLCRRRTPAVAKSPGRELAVCPVCMADSKKVYATFGWFSQQHMDDIPSGHVVTGVQKYHRQRRTMYNDLQKGRLSYEVHANFHYIAII